MIRSLVKTFIVPCVAVTLSGCGALGSLSGGVAIGGTRTLEVTIAEDLNDNYPVAVELGVVYTEALDEELGALQAGQWFKKRERLPNYVRGT